MKRTSPSVWLLFAGLCLLALTTAGLLVVVSNGSRPKSVGPTPVVSVPSSRDVAAPPRHPLADQADEHFRMMENFLRNQEIQEAKDSEEASHQPLIMGVDQPDGTIRYYAVPAEVYVTDKAKIDAHSLRERIAWLKPEWEVWPTGVTRQGAREAWTTTPPGVRRPGAGAASPMNPR